MALSTNKNVHYAGLQAPLACVADFCIIPIGTASASVSNEVASVQQFLATTGLKFTMHSAGTTVEGPWDAVMHVIGQTHSLLHTNGVARVQTDIRVGSRIDKEQTAEDKVQKVQDILAQKAQKEA